jgi:putative alpha-1,2-mannosidase
MLLELVLSLTFLTLAVGALMSVFSSSMISLRTAGISGTAQTLVERQMEVYKTVPYASLKLSSATIPASTTSYYTSAPPVVGTAFTNVAGGTTSASACTDPTYAQLECARQTVTGPDNRSYNIDSYVVAATPTGGRAGVRITVAVRLVSNPTRIEAQTTSAFDPASPPS